MQQHGDDDSIIKSSSGAGKYRSDEIDVSQSNRPLVPNVNSRTSQRMQSQSTADGNLKKSPFTRNKNQDIIRASNNSS